MSPPEWFLHYDETESQFNVPLINCEGESKKTESTNHNLFEEKGEPKRYRAELLMLTNTSLTPGALPRGQTGSQS